MSSNKSATRSVHITLLAIAALVLSFGLALGNRSLVWAQSTDSSTGSTAKPPVDKQSGLDQAKQSEQQKMAAEQKRLEEAAERDARDAVRQEQEKAESDADSPDQIDATAADGLAQAQAAKDAADEAAQTAAEEAQKAAQDAAETEGEDQGQ